MSSTHIETSVLQTFLHRLKPTAVNGTPPKPVGWHTMVKLHVRGTHSGPENARSCLENHQTLSQRGQITTSLPLKQNLTSYWSYPTQSLVLGRGQNLQHVCLKWGALSGGRLSFPRHGALQFTWLRAHQEWLGGKTLKAGCWPLLLPPPSYSQSWFRLSQSENTSHAVCWV